MLCEYCRYRNSWDCEDGWNRRENCSDFELDWNSLSEEKQEAIRTMLEDKRSNYYDDDWY